MADSHTKNHDFHLVDPSPLPVMGSVSAFVMACGAIFFMRDMGPAVLIAGFLGVLTTMFIWFRAVVREAEQEKQHTPIVQKHMQIGMMLFIASEVMFFVAWFWAYFDVSLFPADPIQAERTDFIGGVWPPEGIKTFNPWSLPFINTIILLTSGVTVTWAHHALMKNDYGKLKLGLLLTIILGALFTVLQAYEYSHAHFGFADHIYGSTFFMATGFHGFHVIVGTIFLAVILVRANAGHFTPKQHVGFQAAAWYWHFVDVVWLFLFASIYVWGSGGNAGH
ncbi:MAG: cytochrome c oxidase subunit 3 [Hyphomicrobiales bacterium]|nr:MAG: cytochrome c oxidase subunit 3 [Hyphomicrobiales bacterium]